MISSKPSSRSWLCLYALIVLLSMNVSMVLSAGECPADGGPAPCQACADKNNNFNDLAGVPRMNRKLNKISGELGSYKWFNCDNTGSCSFAISASDAVNSFKSGGSTDAKSPITYTESLFVYMVFGLVAAILTLLIGFGLLIFRYCCCCITGGTCGKRYPTKKTGRCCGMVQNPAGAYEYRRGERWCARITLIIYFCLVVAFVGVGWWNATQGMNDAANNLIESPQPFVSLSKSTITPTSSFVTNLVADTMTNLSISMNNALQSVAPPIRVYNDLTQILAMTTNLPSPDQLLIFMNQVSGVSTNLLSILASANTALNSIDAETAFLSNSIGTLNTKLNALTSGLKAVDADIAATSGNITALNNAVNTITNNVDGTNKIVSDINQLQSLPDPAPLSAALTTCEGPETTAMAARDDAVNKLTQFNQSYGSLPNYQTTASNCQTTNTRLDNLASSHQVDQLLTCINTDQNDIATMSSLIQSLNATINNVTNNVKTYDFNSITNTLTLLNNTLNTLPDFGIVNREVSKINPLTAVVPILIDVSNFITALNASLYAVPNELGAALTISNSLNATLNNALNQANNLLAQANSFLANRSQIDVSNYLSQVTNMKNQFYNATQQLSAGSYTQGLNSVLSSTNNIDWNTPKSGIQTLNNTISNSTNRISPQFITALNAFEPVKQTAASNVQSVLADFLLWQKGYCTGSTTVYCTSDADCSALSAGTCASKGVKRCKNQPSKNCTVNADCTSPDTCIVDDTKVNNLITQLSLVQASQPPQTASTKDILNNINGNSNTQTSGLTTTLSSAQSKIQNVNTAQFSSSIQQVQSGINSFPSTSIRSNLVSVNNSLKSLDLVTPRSYLTSFNNTLNDVLAKRQQLVDAQGLVNALHTITDINFNGYLARLSRSRMNTLFTQGGLSPMLREVGSLVDEIAAIIRNASTIAGNWNPGAVDMLNKYTSILDALSSTSAKGSISYIATLYDAVMNSTSGSSSTFFIPGVGVTEGRYDRDANGNPYPNNKKCVTNTCLHNSFKYYYTSKLSDTMSNVPVNSSPQDMMSYPFLIPLFIAVLSLASMLCLSSHKSASWIASISLCLLFILTPIIFLYEAFAFPAILAVHDTCYGGENVYYQYLIGRQDRACGDFGGKGTAQACTFNFTSSASLVLDVPATARAFMSGVCQNGFDPLNSMWASARSSVSNIPTDKVNSLISSTPQLRPQAQNILLTAAASSSTFFNQYITDLSNTFTCTAVVSAFGGVKDTTCCSMGKAIYWAVAAWYLIAFTMFICGWPALLLGRKRFASVVWGPEADVLPSLPDGLEMNRVSLPHDNTVDNNNTLEGSPNALDGFQATETTAFAPGHSNPMRDSNYNQFDSMRVDTRSERTGSDVIRSPSLVTTVVVQPFVPHPPPEPSSAYEVSSPPPEEFLPQGTSYAPGTL